MTSIDPTVDPGAFRERIRELGRAALTAAIDRDLRTAAEHVRTAVTEYGPAGLSAVLLYFADEMICHSYGGDHRPRRIQLIGFHEATGRIAPAPSAAAGWAARLVETNATGDDDRVSAVLDELTVDGATGVGERIGALLGMVAATMRGLPRGYMLIGAGHG